MTEQKSISCYSKPIQEQYAALTSTNQFVRTALAELLSLKKSCPQVKALGAGFGDTPLTVISATKPVSSKETGLTQTQCEEMGKQFAELQTDLVKQSSKSKQVFAENSTHMVMRDQPEIVIDAIQKMLASLRDTPP